MFGLRLGKMGLSSSQTLNKMAQAILRSFGSNASSYPLSTLSGAYQTSAGPAAAAVNDPIGFELDAMGTVGVELVTVTPVFTSLDASFVASTSGGTLIAAPTGTLVGYFPSSGPLFVGGKAYQITVTISSYVSGAVALLFFGGGTESQQINGTVTFTVRLDAGATGVAYLYTKAAGTTLTIDSISAREVTGNHATQPTAINRPTVQQDGNGRFYASFNGTNQWIATASGGGASTGFFLCDAFQTAAAGVAQTLWSDRSGNTGLKLEITAGNVLQFSGGNGAAIIAAVGNAVSTGTAYIVTAKYDGSNLSVQLNNAAAVTAACALSAGTAAVTIGADPGGASGFFNGGFYDTPFIKNGLPTAAQEATIKSATGLRAGLVL